MTDTTQPADARETYAKLHANTSGPSHQGQTSREAQAALDEINRLRREVDQLRASLAAVTRYAATL